MVSKNQTKLISSLQYKKFRDASGLFVAEGPKVIDALLKEGLNLHWLFTTDELQLNSAKHHIVNDLELKKLSFLKTPNTSLAVFQIPKLEPPLKTGLIVALDALRDPGNLGTIIRLCDWFGVEQLICSLDTADCFNPKVVQATMGSLARVQVHYLNLADYLKESELPIYGGFMDGKNIYSESLPSQAIIVMGNEANGISEEIISKITHKISIPRFGEIQKAESLNVATATGILLSEFKRFTEK